jgi:hypothetical protein
MMHTVTMLSYIYTFSQFILITSNTLRDIHVKLCSCRYIRRKTLPDSWNASAQLHATAATRVLRSSADAIVWSVEGDSVVASLTLQVLTTYHCPSLSPTVAIRTRSHGSGSEECNVLTIVSV